MPRVRTPRSDAGQSHLLRTSINTAANDAAASRFYLLATASFLFLATPCFAGKPQSLTSPDQVLEGLEKSDWQSIRAAHDAWQHEFREIDGTWQAQNPGQRWTTTFDGRGFLATPKEAAWTWGLELKSYGFDNSQQTVTGTPEIKAAGQRLSYHWQGGLEEWFVNDQRGLEHGFIVSERPQGATEGEPLVFTLSTLGGLRPAVSKDSQTVHFRDALGAPVLNYSGLKVWDADGKILTSRFEAVGENQFRLLVDEAGAHYPITIDPIAQQAYLKAGNNGPASDDRFGSSVAVSGDTVVIGALYEDSGTTGVNSAPDDGASDSGAAYVFTRSGSTWSQQAYLKASNTRAFDYFGTSVAVSGDTVVVGANGESSSTTGVDSTPNESTYDAGAAYVFTRDGTTWSQQAYLKASNTGADDRFGNSVAVSGDTVVVGAAREDSSTTGVNSTPNNNASDSGAAYVFTRSGKIWSQQAYLKASNTGGGDYFGDEVAVSGDTVVVGSEFENSGTRGVNSTPNNSASDSGAAYVFVRSSTTWSQQAYLKASNTDAFDNFGNSVEVSGDTVVVGAQRESSSTTGVNSTPDGNADNSGAAYVFIRSGTTWSQQAYLKASNTESRDFFGTSVAVSGDTVVVGAELEGSSGAAYIFTRSGTTWSQQAYLKASNAGAYDDRLGNSVAVSGDTVVVGAFFEDSNTTGVNSTPNEIASNSGAAYVFTRSGTTWSQQAYLKASNTPSGSGLGDNFGSSVSVSGDTVVVGAPGEDSSTTGVNSTPIESASSSGAAYVFTRSGTTWSQQAYIKASNTGAGDGFGRSVAVAGDTVVIGADREDSSTTGVNSTPNESAYDSGAAYVFTRSGTTWSQQAYLKASNTGGSLFNGDSFGESVAVSGDTVVIGAPGEDSSTTGVNSTPNEGASYSGAAYVFARNGTTWSQQAYFKASNTEGNDSFGISVAVSGDTVVVGALNENSSTTGVNSTPNESASGSGSGAAYVFTRSGTTWSQQAYLKASNTGAGDGFGFSVAVSGDTVVVGAPFEESSTTGVNSTPNESTVNSGATYVFTRSGTTWSQQAYLKASTTGGDLFGYSAAVSGDTLIIGAPYEDSGTTGVNSAPDNKVWNSGAAYVFTRNGTTWSQQAYLKASNTGKEDEFGGSVAVSGDTVVVGAYGEDSGTAGVNSTPDDNSTKSGAAYIFAGFDPGAQAPAIGITTSSGITGSGAILGGTVVSEGGAAITERGVVHSVTSSNPNPLIGGSGVVKTTTSGTIGVFTVAVNGLSPSTKYSFKAYATNANGTSYTPVATFSTTPYVLTTSATNGTIQRSPDLASYAAGSVVTLTAVGTGDVVFQGWTGVLFGATNPTTITMDANKSVRAVFIPSIAGALDASGLTYTFGGNANWFPQATTTHDGADAAQSGAIGHSQQSWFETTVTGPGSLSYWWKVSSEGSYDYLEFYIDGVLQSGRISGEVDWARKNHEIPSGSHVLRWRYAKDGSVIRGSDAAWVDQVVWVPEGPPQTYAAATAAAGLTGNDALPNSIPFNDGVENLLKYAFNMNLATRDVTNMTSGGNAGLPAIRQVGTGAAGILRFEFVRRMGTGLVYTPKKSTTLDATGWTNLTDTPTIVPINANWERVIYEEPSDPRLVPKCFGRVEVEIP